MIAGRCTDELSSGELKYPSSFWRVFYSIRIFVILQVSVEGEATLPFSDQTCSVIQGLMLICPLTN